MKLVKIRDQPTSEYELRAMAQEILERAKRDPDGFIEVEKRGITVVQIGSMRIAIARRPFSDGMEITAVRPIVDVTLKDYTEVRHDHEADHRRKTRAHHRRLTRLGKDHARPERCHVPVGHRATWSRPWKLPANSRSRTRSPSTRCSTAAWPTPLTCSCSSGPTSLSSTNSGRTRTSLSLATCGSRASAWSASSTQTACGMRSSGSLTA